jgi:hypothetical protein
MKTEGCIEMGIKMTLDSVNTTRLTYDKNVSVAHPVEIVTNFLNNLFILPTFTIVESFDGSPLDDI